MVRISVIAAFGAAIFLSACQSDQKPVTGSNLDATLRVQQAQQDAQTLGEYVARTNAELDGKPRSRYRIVSHINPDAIAQPPSVTKIRVGLSSHGTPWSIFHGVSRGIDSGRMGNGSSIYIFGAITRGDGYDGKVDVLLFGDGRALDPRRFDEVWADRQEQAGALGEQFSLRLKDRAWIGGVETPYALYRTGGEPGRECVIFVRNKPTAGLRGDICGPPGEGMGRKRAVAIIRGIGVDPTIPIEATQDLSTLSVD